MPTLVHTCDECDSEFQLKYDIDKCDSDPTYCPFCSDPIENADQDEMEED